MYYLKFLIDIRFSIFLLFLICFMSSIGSFIEQDRSINFYLENYSSIKPIMGFIDSSFIFFFGLNHIYQTSWFFFLIFLFFLSLVSCTLIRQFPLVKISKKYLFKKKETTFKKLSFIKNFINFYFFNESFISKLQYSTFFLYQKKNVIYGYKGLIGRISPILVHLSLILILLGSTFSSFKGFKLEEFLPQGEIFTFQNFINLNFYTKLSNITFRLNDFWIEYDQNITQFYSNLSILDNYGNELLKQTISVNNPLIYKGVYFYQNEWSLTSLRIKKFSENLLIFETQINLLHFQLFPINKNSKFWVSFLSENSLLIFDSFKHNYYFYFNDFLLKEQKIFYQDNLVNYIVIETIFSSGLLFKYDIMLKFIYLGFILLIITVFLSYLPYNQLWILEKKSKLWIGGLTNRYKGQLYIEFENVFRKTNF